VTRGQAQMSLDAGSGGFVAPEILNIERYGLPADI
jgi:hypothetical protein